MNQIGPPHLRSRRNIFQELMRSWTELAPYNAGHVLQVSGAADTARWRRALTDSVRQVEPTLREILVEESSQSIESAISEQLNRPFTEAEPPVRACIIRSENDSHYLGVIFDHWFADSPSMRTLLQRAFRFYQGATSSELPAIQILHGSTLSARASTLRKLRGIVSGVKLYLENRRACRLHFHAPNDFQADFFRRQFPPGAVHHIRAAAGRCGGKVNDAFLAAAAQVLGDYTAQRRASSRRRFLRAPRDRVGLATAVDLRPFAGQKGAADAFGFFLGYFTIVLSHPEQLELAKLIPLIAARTSAMKSERRLEQFSLNLKLVRLFWKFLPGHRAELFQKGCPLVAGISNVNLTESWIGQAVESSTEPRLLDYWRVSPVGPLLPLVFTPSTVGDKLSLCVVYRTTAFTRDAAERIADDLMTNLLKLADCESAN